MEHSGPVQACNGIALPAVLPDIYAMMADLDSRNMLSIVKDYCTRPICCVRSDIWHLIAV